jgi:hypothetical protein
MHESAPTEPAPPPRKISDLLAELVATRDVPCPGCGYNLRGITSTRCPECNQPLTLTVGLAERKLAWFVVGIAGLAMGAGFGLLIYAALIVQHFAAGYPMTELQKAWPLLATGAVCAALTCAWSGLRRRLHPKPASLRWGLALGTFVLSCALAALCFIRAN